MDCLSNQSICFSFLKTGECFQNYCHKIHIEVCSDFQNGNCDKGEGCKKWHPVQKCKWELQEKGSCRNGSRCTFSHFFNIRKDNTCQVINNKDINLLSGVNKGFNFIKSIDDIDLIRKDISQEKLILEEEVKSKRNSAKVLINKINIEISLINSQILKSYDDVKSHFNKKNMLHEKILIVIDSLSKFENSIKLDYDLYIKNLLSCTFFDIDNVQNKDLFETINSIYDFLKIKPEDFKNLFSIDVNNEINKMNQLRLIQSEDSLSEVDI